MPMDPEDFAKEAKERIEDQHLIGKLDTYSESVSRMAEHYTTLTESAGREDDYDGARRHILMEDRLEEEFYDPEDGWDKQRILDMGLGSMEEFADWIIDRQLEAQAINADLYSEVETAGHEPAGEPQSNVHFHTHVGGEGAGGGAGGGCKGGGLPYDIDDLESLGTALIDHWQEDDDDGRRGRYGESFNVSLDTFNTNDAEAVPGEPFSPTYSMSISAEAETHEEAVRHLNDELDEAERLVVEGYNLSDGNVDPVTLIDEPWDNVEGELRGMGATKKLLPGLHRLGDWDIDEEGHYNLVATIEKEDGSGHLGESGPFTVSGPETDATGLGLSIMTEEEAELVTGINRSAAPDYMVRLTPGDLSGEAYLEAASEYLNDAFEGLAVEWGEAENVYDLDDGAFPVMGDTQAEIWNPGANGLDYFSDIIPDAYMEDAYVEQGWLYHPGIGQFVLPTPVPIEFEEGEELGMRVDALDDLGAGEGPGYAHASWSDVDDFGWFDFAGTVFGALNWLDKGMPLSEVEEEVEEAEEEEGRPGLLGSVKDKISGKAGQFIGDTPDHYITDLVEEHTFLGQYVGN